MRKSLGMFLLVGAALASIAALPPLAIKRPFKLKLINRGLAGEVLDYTNNHHRDNRIWSESLGHKTDLYVYLPPGYNPQISYPVFYWLHGFTQDENCLIDHIIRPMDKAIRDGILPPMIVVAPDGNLKGDAVLVSPGSFFANTKAGRYEDMFLNDISSFVEENFSVATGRENQAIGGVSMGGGSAARIALKHPERFGTCLTIFPPLNIRYENTRGDYLGKYIPGYWQYREDFSRGMEPIGRFFGGAITIRLWHMLDPLYDRTDPNLPSILASENPTELVPTYDSQKFPLSLYIASAGRDQFNLGSQADTFMDAAEGSGIDITRVHDPRGTHSLRTANKMAPDAIRWLGQKMTESISGETP